MQKMSAFRSAAGTSRTTAGLLLLLASPIFTHVAAAQVPAAVDPERQYTFPVNQAIVDITSTLDGSSYAGRHALYAGAQLTTLLSGGGGLLPSSFSAYCVDIASPILRPSQDVTVKTLDSTFSLGGGSQGINVGGAIAWLYNNNYASISGETEAMAERSAALQLSIWEIEYNWTGVGLGGIDPTLATGNFYYEGTPTSLSPVTFDPIATAAVRADAASMLNIWNGQTTTGTLLDGIQGTSQSLVGPPPVTNTAAPSRALSCLLPVPCSASSARRFVRRRRK